MTAEAPALVNPAVLDAVGDLAGAFATARPFRHVAIDNFFRPEVARELADRFPPFDARLAENENGVVGAKAVNENVRDLGPAWVRLDDEVQGAPFRDLIAGITGIPHLQYDPDYFGGGTHENLHGRGLDAHVDFNLHPVTRLHRRLNLIVYLTEEWREEWGGSIQLHKDPYLPPEKDEIAVVTPSFNRAVIFETNEHSWHGFPCIDLPEDKRHISRRSFALYYYTVTRPAAELGPQHATVYVEPPLPDTLKAGEPLSVEQLEQVQSLIASRDQHLRRLYGDIKRLYTELNEYRERSGIQPPPGVAEEPRPVRAFGKNLAAAEDAEVPGSGMIIDDKDPVHLSAELHQREAVIRLLRHRVRELEQSTSWRVTKPLRALKRLLGQGDGP